MKTCRKCGETKPLSEYTRDVRLRDRVQNSCRTCRNKRDKHKIRSRPRPCVTEPRVFYTCLSCRTAAFLVLRPSPRNLCAPCLRATANANVRARKARNKTAYNEKIAAHLRRHPEVVAARERRKRARLTYSYVRRLLARAAGAPVAQIPQDLVEVKQLQLKLKRYYDEHTKNTA